MPKKAQISISNGKTMIEALGNKLALYINPMAQKINENKTLRSVSEGFMRTMPLTLGIALFAIVGNFPIPAWLTWLKETGMNMHFTAMLNASMNVLSIFVVFSIAFCYARSCKKDALTCGFLSLASFLALMIQYVPSGDKQIAAYKIDTLGPDGMFVGLLVGLLVSHAFVYLSNKKLMYKMPDSVPPMVSESLGPVFIAMMIFGFVFAIRVGFSFTSFGTIFAFITQIVSIPLLKIGTSTPAIIFFCMMFNFVWFFGIHPNTVRGPLVPILMTVIMANIVAFQKGEAMPYIEVCVIYTSCAIGGDLKIGLNFCMMFFAKSKRYRSLNKISLIPSIFNINEPIIFGFPMMLNPIMFLPMLLSPLFVGIASFLMYKMVGFSFNPTADMLPWTTPFFVKSLMAGGVVFLCMQIICALISTITYFPFFKIADKQAFEEEQNEACVVENTIQKD